MTQREKKRPGMSVIPAVLMVALLGLSMTATAAPKLTMPESVFNFGVCPQNSAVSHQFWLYSTGDDTLKILKVIPGCGCTKAPLERDVLPIGDSTRIEIIFHTKHYKGRMIKRPRIQTNVGPDDQYIQFLADVTARPDSTYPVQISPYKVNLSQSDNAPVDRMTFEIENKSDIDLNLTLISEPSDLMSVELPEVVKARSTGTGTVVLTTEGTAREFEKSFTFEVNDETTSRFTVPVWRAIRHTNGGQAHSDAAH